MLLVGSRHGFLSHLDAVNHKFGGGTSAEIIARANAAKRAPGPGQPERDPADAVLHPGLHDVELLVGLHVRGAEERARTGDRQLSVMFGALIWDVALLILGAQALFRIA